MNYPILLNDLPATAHVTRYCPRGAGVSHYGSGLGPPDPEELEFDVYLPCGCQLDLTEAQARDVEAQLMERRDAS